MINSSSRTALRAVALAGAIAGSLWSGQALQAQGQPPLPDEMAAAARQLRAQLPKQVDDVTTWTGIDSRGTEFVYEMAVSIAVPSAQLATVGRAIQEANQTRLCADPSSGALIRRGASMRHYYTDQAGNRFETLVASCPPAAAN